MQTYAFFLQLPGKSRSLASKSKKGNTLLDSTENVII